MLPGALLPIIHEKQLFVQLGGSGFMLEFAVRLGSVQDVQDFVPEELFEYEQRDK